MRQEQFGGETVYRVYERERLRRMARKLGLRLLTFRKATEQPSQDRDSRSGAYDIAAMNPASAGTEGTGGRRRSFNR